jgi:hypothetical protein
MRRLMVTTFVLAAAIVIGGCSGGTASAPAAGANGTSTTTATSSSTPPAPKTAEEVGKALAGKVASSKVTVVYTAASDPNKLLGRPNGYLSKIAFSDSRVSPSDVEGTDSDAVERGGSVEVYADADGAKKRSDYIQAIAKGLPAAGEYDYLSGAVLVRVSRVLTPDQARDYETALKTIS